MKLEDSRRNILTRGVEINELIGTEFFTGEVRLRGHRITQPFLYLEKLLDQPGLYNGLRDNAGINCNILSDGTIKPGDAIITASD